MSFISCSLQLCREATCYHGPRGSRPQIAALPPLLLLVFLSLSRAEYTGQLETNRPIVCGKCSVVGASLLSNTTRFPADSPHNTERTNEEERVALLNRLKCKVSNAGLHH